jgi:predicted nucleotidyltransferase
MKIKLPNVASIELIAQALGPLREQLVLVGGCAVDLLLTDTAAAPTRVTYDVDLVAEVAALADYHELEKQFNRLGFMRDMTPDAPICRWRFNNLEVDLMPALPGILGFSNRWYPLAVQTASRVMLPSGTSIQLITAPAFLATKFEAFIGRGNNDLLASHDMEDIINVLDGRPEIVTEVVACPNEMRQYLVDQCRLLLALPNIMDAVSGMVFPDDFLAERVKMIKVRIEKIVAIEDF